MYNITNEKISITKAIKYYTRIRKDLIALMHKDIEKSIMFKVNKFINKNITIEEYFDCNKSEYYYNRKIDGKNFFTIEVALRDLNVWLEAINRGNRFTIDEYSYKDFLSYINNNNK